MKTFFKKPIVLINICLLLIVVYLGLTIFHIDLKSLFIRPVCKDCNVILISLDTLGANHLPCYGYDRNTAPNLCKFASENILFRNAYSNAGWTLPSHFSIFTSLYPKHHNMETYSDTLSNKIPTLTEILNKNGYQTIWVGSTNDPTLPLNKGLGRGFNKIISNAYRTNIDQWTKGLNDFIENSNKGKKTFLFLHTYWVHDPYLLGNIPNRDKNLFIKDNAYSIPMTTDEFFQFTSGFYKFLIDSLSQDNNESLVNLLSANKKEELIIKLKSAKDLADREAIFTSFLPVTSS